MQVFNNFGQLLWESTALDSNGTPTEGWNGTYKGKIVEQGVYIWQCSGTLLNGEAWKGMSYGNGTPSLTGPIHLIR
jgi:large repetitive protein